MGYMGMESPFFDTLTPMQRLLIFGLGGTIATYIIFELIHLWFKKYAHLLPQSDKEHENKPLYLARYTISTLVHAPVGIIGCIWFVDFVLRGSKPSVGLGKFDDLSGICACAMATASAAEGFAILIYEEIRKDDRIWHLMLVHHIVVFTMSMLCLYYNRISMLGIAGMATEFSTINLNAMGLIDHRHIWTNFVKYNMISFPFTFFITRNIGFTYFFIWFCIHFKNDWPDSMPEWLGYMYAILISFLTALQFYLFIAIVKKAIRTLKRLNAKDTPAMQVPMRNDDEVSKSTFKQTSDFI